MIQHQSLGLFVSKEKAKNKTLKVSPPNREHRAVSPPPSCASPNTFSRSRRRCSSGTSARGAKSQKQPTQNTWDRHFCPWAFKSSLFCCWHLQSATRIYKVQSHHCHEKSNLCSPASACECMDPHQQGSPVAWCRTIGYCGMART